MSISKTIVFIAKILTSEVNRSAKHKWEKFHSDALMPSKVQGWRREKDGGGYEYRYQDSDPNQESSGDQEGSGKGKDKAKPEIHDPSFKNGQINPNYTLPAKDIENNDNFRDISFLLKGSKKKPLGGTTGAYLLENPVTSDKYVIKEYKNSGGLLQIKNELLANNLYREFGAGTPVSSITLIGKTPALCNSFITIDKDSPDKVKDMTYYHERAQTNFVMDAWLGNWDVVGLEYDNLGVDTYGGLVRLDNGGALLFRAMGGLKGKAFSDDVTELKTMRDPAINESAATVFGGLSDEEIAKQASLLVKKFPKEKIEKMVKNVFDKEPEIAQYLINKLLARRKYILDFAMQVAHQVIKTKVLKRKERYNIPPVQMPGELTQQEQDQIHEYTGSWYEHVNPYLREEKIKEYDDPEELKKGAETIVSGLKKLPPYQATVYRGSNIDPHTMMVLANMKAGDVIYMKGFTSTSKVKDQMFHKSVAFHINSKTGRDISELSGIKEEQEVLFAPDSRFRVKSISQNGPADFVVELDEILPDENRTSVPVNTEKKELTPEGIRTFLLKNPKLSPKQRERIMRLGSDDLFKIAMAIFANSSSSAKETEPEDEQQPFASGKFTEIFI